MLAGIFFALNLRLAECSVVVNRDLGVSSHDLSSLRNNERVDFDHIAVALNEAVKDMLEQVYYLALVFWDTKVRSSLDQILHFGAVVDIDMNLEDFLWVRVSNVLNGHATSRAVDEHGALGLAIESHAQIELFIDSDLLNDVDAIARESCVTRLLCDQGLSTHLISDLLHFLRSLNNVHTALEVVFLEVTQAAASAEHLCLHDILHLLLHAKLAGNEQSLLAVEGNVT